MIPLVQVTNSCNKALKFKAWCTGGVRYSGVFVLGNAIYCIFISGEVQSWNDPDGHSNDERDVGLSYDDRELRVLEEKLKLTN